MDKKTWTKPEVRKIKAGAAESSDNTASDGAPTAPQKAS